MQPLNYDKLLVKRVASSLVEASTTMTTRTWEEEENVEEMGRMVLLLSGDKTENSTSEEKQQLFWEHQELRYPSTNEYNASDI